MAKLNAPLMSFGARGAIAKAVVYFPWKGINCAREYVVPANPRSAAQIIQRNILKAAVTEWHAVVYTALDLVGWNRLAGTLADTMSGFNAMIRTHVTEKLLGNVWTRIDNAVISAVGPATFTVTVDKVSGGLAPYIWYGTSKTFLPSSQICTDLTGGKWAGVVAGLQSDTLYYFTVIVGVSAATYGRIGIYQQKTT